jgi:hypothetical protein
MNDFAVLANVTHLSHAARSEKHALQGTNEPDAKISWTESNTHPTAAAAIESLAAVLESSRLRYHLAAMNTSVPIKITTIVTTTTNRKRVSPISCSLPHKHHRIVKGKAFFIFDGEQPGWYETRRNDKSHSTQTSATDPPPQRRKWVVV